MRPLLAFLLSLLGCGGPELPDLCNVQPGKPLPAAPPEQAADGSGQTFVVRRLRLGARDPDGTPNPSAWKKIGLDLDGRADVDSTVPFECHCQPVGGAQDYAVFTDGEDGIDNSFAHEVLQSVVFTPALDVEDQTQAEIDAGHWSLPPTTVFVRLELGGVPLRLEIQRAVLVLVIAEDRSSAAGVLGGVLDPEVVAPAAAQANAALAPGWCGARAALEGQVREASDIPWSGTHDPSVPCAAISIGLGLELVPAVLGAALGPEPPPADPCPSP